MKKEINFDFEKDVTPLEILIDFYNLNFYKLAKLTDSNPVSISKIVKGAAILNASSETIKNICNVLNISSDLIFNITLDHAIKIGYVQPIYVDFVTYFYLIHLGIVEDILDGKEHVIHKLNFDKKDDFYKIINKKSKIEKKSETINYLEEIKKLRLFNTNVDYYYKLDIYSYRLKNILSNYIDIENNNNIFDEIKNLVFDYIYPKSDIEKEIIDYININLKETMSLFEDKNENNLSYFPMKVKYKNELFYLTMPHLNEDSINIIHYEYSEWISRGILLNLNIYSPKTFILRRGGYLFSLIKDEEYSECKKVNELINIDKVIEYPELDLNNINSFLNEVINRINNSFLNEELKKDLIDLYFKMVLINVLLGKNINDIFINKNIFLLKNIETGEFKIGPILNNCKNFSIDKKDIVDTMDFYGGKFLHKLSETNVREDYQLLYNVFRSIDKDLLNKMVDYNYKNFTDEIDKILNDEITFCDIINSKYNIYFKKYIEDVKNLFFDPLYSMLIK